MKFPVAVGCLLSFFTVVSCTSAGKDNALETGSDNDIDSASTDSVGFETDTGATTGQFTFVAVTSNAIPTVGVVRWILNGVTPDSAKIEFGATPAYGMEVAVDMNEPDYRTLLLGLKKESAYHFRVVAQSAGETFVSDDQVLTTGPTLSVARPIIEVVQPSKVENGFIVLASYMGGAGILQTPQALIYDDDGDLVWFHKSTLTDSSRARMSYDGKWMALIPVNNTGDKGRIELVSMDGTKEKKFEISQAAHDLTPTDDNTFAFLAYEPDSLIGSMMTSTCAKAVEVDLDGNTRLIFDSATLWGSDCHGNALRYSADDGLFTLSEYNKNAIVAFDKQGNVKWVTRNNGDWTTQHGHQLLAGNRLLLFNNGGHFSMSNLTSSALEFNVDGDGNVTPVWSYSVEGLGTPTLGDVQRLPNGNTLISYSNSAVIHEVDADGGLVRSWDFGQTAFGYVVWRPTLYGPPIDLLL
ncbi:MAG: hypothetical protein JXR76_07580 [Deltaproteobacteria bacterium]|nr:hypothetical protein [Deltaproteobacteria bacterium]